MRAGERDKQFSAGHGGKKSRKLDAFVAAMMTHGSTEAAAEAVGIAASTGYRWARDRAVIERLRQARQQAWGRAMAQLQEAGPEAVEALRKVLREAENETPRVSAARTILELGLKSVEIGDITARLEHLEEIAKTRNWREPDEQSNHTPTGTTRGSNGHA
jgi:hypothetical protein